MSFSKVSILHIDLCLLARSLLRSLSEAWELLEAGQHRLEADMESVGNSRLAMARLMTRPVRARTVTSCPQVASCAPRTLLVSRPELKCLQVASQHHLEADL